MYMHARARTVVARTIDSLDYLWFREVFGLKMIHYAYCSLMIKYNYCGNGFMVPVLEKQKWNHASIHSYCQHAPQDALLFLYIMKVKHMKKVYYLYV